MTFEKILNALEKYCDLNELSCGNAEYKIQENFPYECEMSCGVSKACLIFPNFEYVIKIPFDLMYDEWDEDEWEMCNAPMGAEWNYCLSEVRLYEKMEEEYLVGDVFAKLFEIGEVKGTPIYAQKKCEVYAEMAYKHHSKKEQTSVRKSLYESQNWRRPSFNPDWLIDAVDFYGEQYVARMLDALGDEFLDDFHNGNIGYCAGQPVIIDWGGFNE